MRVPQAIRVAVVLALTVASLGIAAGASAANPTGTIKLDPATAQVDNGGTFSVKVLSNTTVPISAVSVTITFNKAIVQVTSVTRSAAWAAAPLFLAGDAPAISTANKKGKLQNVAASFFPPTSVPAGAQEFITVGFKAIACGTVKMDVPQGRVDSTMLDGREATYGATIKLATAGANITVCAPTVGGLSASVDPNASPSPSDSGAVLPSDSFDPNASASPVAPVESTQAGGAVGGVAPSSAPSGAPVAYDPNAAASSSSEQSGWLMFAMAALAIAAAGLAALILVLTVVAITAAVIGAIVVFRFWRRSTAADREAAAVEEPVAEAEPAAVADPGTVEAPAPEPQPAPARRGAVPAANS